MSGVPADVVNQALDQIGCDLTIGDLQEGTVQARAALRHYSPTLMQVLRSAHWNFARKQATLALLQDATGQTTAAQTAAGGPVTVGTGTIGQRPWIYEYQYPPDCMQARWVPATQYPVSPGGAPVPLMTNLAIAPTACQIPTRFLVGSDAQSAGFGVPASWAGFPDTAGTVGQGRATQTVILTNQPRATLVYTALIPDVDEWDPFFRQAFAAVLASFLAMPCLPDKKFAIAMQARAGEAAKKMLDQARIRDGDEGWTTTDHYPDWLRVRTSGGWSNGGFGAGGGLGAYWYGWGACGFGDGSAY